MTAERQFEEGDLVRLRAGGPIMTVKFFVGDFLLCAWIDAAGRDRRGTFSTEQLVHEHAPPPVWLLVLLRLSSTGRAVAAI